MSGTILEKGQRSVKLNRTIYFQFKSMLFLRSRQHSLGSGNAMEIDHEKYLKFQPFCMLRTCNLQLYKKTQQNKTKIKTEKQQILRLLGYQEH